MASWELTPAEWVPLAKAGAAMTILEDVKHIAEVVTGIGRPGRRNIRVRTRKANASSFRDDGKTPNNPHYPLIVYRTPLLAQFKEKGVPKPATPSLSTTKLG